jgi:hypothetical protein
MLSLPCLFSDYTKSEERSTRLYSFTVRFIVVRSEVFTAVTMKNGVFWDVMPCGSCKNRRFGGT